MGEGILPGQRTCLIELVSLKSASALASQKPSKSVPSGLGRSVEPGAGIPVLSLQFTTGFYTGAKPVLFSLSCRKQTWTISNKPANSGLLVLGSQNPWALHTIIYTMYAIIFVHMCIFMISVHGVPQFSHGSVEAPPILKHSSNFLGCQTLRGAPLDN